MPSKIVDLSSRSKIIRDEPFYVHFWECKPSEYLALLKNPRRVLAEMGIDIPKECRIETTIENHDWLGESTGGFTAADNGIDYGEVCCNIANKAFEPAVQENIDGIAKQFAAIDPMMVGRKPRRRGLYSLI